MHRSRLVAALCLALWVTSARAAAPADDATLVRVFLKDGKSLVSYGEPALVADRVVFSMPITTTPNPPLHLVDVPLARVDWERTTRYATAARAAHYVQYQAAADYAALSSEIARTLNEVAATSDPAKRIAIVERARGALADWPQNHYNYRADRSPADAVAARRGDRGSACRHRRPPVRSGAHRLRRSPDHRRAAAAAADAAGVDRADAARGAGSSTTPPIARRCWPP